jgi:hypothetical protein
MPLISAPSAIYATDGVTPHGFGVTPSGGTEVVFNAAAVGAVATTTAVETAVQNLAGT